MSKSKISKTDQDGLPVWLVEDMKRKVDEHKSDLRMCGFSGYGDLATQYRLACDFEKEE